MIGHWKMKQKRGYYLDESYTRFIGTAEAKNTNKKRAKRKFQLQQRKTII